MAKLSLRNRIFPGVTKAPKQGGTLFNNKGEINASTTKDAIYQLGQILMTASTPVIDGETTEAVLAAKDERRARLTAAMSDKTGEQLAILGAALSAEIIDTTNRDGFCRRLLQVSETPQGDLPRIGFKDKQATAYTLSSPSQVVPVEIRNREYILNEFDINAQILIDNKELARTSNDLLEEKYEETLEAVMVQEDRYWKHLADRTAKSIHNIQGFAQFSPDYFAKMRDLIDRNGLPVVNAVMSSTLMKDIISSTQFQEVFDPMTQYEVLMTGEMGSIYNTTIISDSMRQPNLRVLEEGEIYFVAPPVNHGAICTRPMVTEPINLYNTGVNKRGWFFSETIAMIIGNNKSVVKGHRLS